MSVDLIPWRAENTSIGVSTKVRLHKAPDSVDVLEREGILARHYHKLQTFLQCWVVFPKLVNFHDILYTFGAFRVQFPYKWKCWVPYWLRISSGC